MSGELVILVPVLGRPDNVGPLLDSIEGATPGARTLFLCDVGDDAEIDAVLADKRAHLDISGGNYAQKINRGIQITAEPLIFCGADDLRFRPGWLEAARSRLRGVVGINDMLVRNREHTTHFLVARSYAERGTTDGEPGLLCERYRHNFVDDELIATARKRGLYDYAPDAEVEHLHPVNRKARLDRTYLAGMEAMEHDRAIYRERESLWT